MLCQSRPGLDPYTPSLQLQSHSCFHQHTRTLSSTLYGLTPSKTEHDNDKITTWDRRALSNLVYRLPWLKTGLQTERQAEVHNRIYIWDRQELYRYRYTTGTDDSHLMPSRIALKMCRSEERTQRPDGSQRAWMHLLNIVCLNPKNHRFLAFNQSCQSGAPFKQTEESEATVVILEWHKEKE